MTGAWTDNGSQSWEKGKKRSIKIYTLKVGDRVRMQIDISVSVIDHKCTVQTVTQSGSVILYADSEEFVQSYKVAKDGWIVLNPDDGLKRKALITRL